MQFEYPATAIHIMSRPKLAGVVEHDGILRESRFERHLIELHPVHGLRISRWDEVEERLEFEVSHSVPPLDLDQADARLHQLLRSPPDYSLLDANCQDAASYVAIGRSESRDRRAAGTLAVFLGAVWVAGTLLAKRKTSAKS